MTSSYESSNPRKLRTQWHSITLQASWICDINCSCLWRYGTL